MIVKEKIQTKYGEISYFDSKTRGENLVFLHGLSCCKEVFFDQFEKLQKIFRIIIPDLLGHGESDDATDKNQAYTIPGFAESILELFEKLNLSTVYVFGWSLGGSITVELLEKFKGIKKTILHGYPPVSFLKKNFQEAYAPTEYTHLIGMQHWTEDDVRLFLNSGGLKPRTEAQKETFKLISKMAQRSDGNMREILYASIISGTGVSPMECVEKHRDKITLLVGENDHGLQKDYFKKYFSDITIIIPNSGHASFWDKSEIVNDLIIKTFRMN